MLPNFSPPPPKEQWGKSQRSVNLSLMLIELAASVGMAKWECVKPGCFRKTLENQLQGTKSSRSEGMRCPGTEAAAGCGSRGCGKTVTCGMQEHDQLAMRASGKGRGGRGRGWKLRSSWFLWVLSHAAFKFPLLGHSQGGFPPGSGSRCLEQVKQCKPEGKEREECKLLFYVYLWVLLRMHRRLGWKGAQDVSAHSVAP